MFFDTETKLGLRVAALIVLLSSRVAVAEPVSCSDTSPSSGKVYSVTGKQVNLRDGPGTSYQRVRDESNELAKLDQGYIVRENCREGDWSQINLLSPDWLRKTHRGWVHSRFLAN